MIGMPKSLPNLPRYTSYPTAPHFTAQQADVARSMLLENVREDEPVSVYLHIPFCDRLCWFCGCHTKHTLKYRPVANYVDVLVEEIEQFSKRVGFKPKLGHLHLGGGSPSLLKIAEAAKLRAVLEKSFTFLEDTEASVELDPNDQDDEFYDMLKCLGITRASLGVQDFDPKVQQVINREQGYETTAKLISNLRGMGVRSLNIDMLYGLPCQTVKSITSTTQKVLSLEPDRIALFGYAHVPHLKKHQMKIDANTLPDDSGRLAQAQRARQLLLQAGLEAIGIDHFAKKTDTLAIAKRNKTLRRNFQGYTTDTAPVLIGFGASSISNSAGCHVQNTVATGEYARLVKAGKHPAQRGLILSQDDRIRSFIIQSLMCNFQVDTSDVENEFGKAANPYLTEIRRVAAENPYGLCRFANGVLELLPGRQEYVRFVASRFDAYLQEGASLYSKAV